MQMLIFILFTVLIMAANVGGYHFLWKAIQPGEMFGHWQRVLKWGYNKNEYLERFLGGCQVCFAHFCAILGFIAYTIFMNVMDLDVIKGWLHAIWYLFYVSLVWWVGMMTIKETKEGTD